MGLTKLLIKHGIGSPGSIAKRQMRLYKLLRQKHPGVTEQEILAMMWMGRAEAGRMTGAGFRYEALMSDEYLREFLNKPNVSIKDLIMRIILAEDQNHIRKPIELRMLEHDVVDEVLDEELPGWRRE
jgi:hypothetical protein